MPHVIHDDLEFVDTTIRPVVDFRSDEVHDQPQYKDFCDSTHANGDLDRHHEQLISRQAVSVKGKLSQSVEFWRDTLKANNYVLSVISNGYVLPFKEEPPHKVFRNHNVCSKYSKFIDESVQELLVNDCVQQTLEVPHVCSPLSVVCSSTGKLRLVLDLRYVNRYLWKYKFKYEDLRTVMSMFSCKDYLFTFDLKSGYHHVDISANHWRYLGFSWNDRYYLFKVLPFGLSTACYLFTKPLRPLVHYWRSKGIRVVVYIDDGIVAAESFEQVLALADC